MKTDDAALHDALVELATTMSQNRDRLRQIRQRVDQRRRRRVATGAVVSVGAVAGAVALTMVPRDARSSAPTTLAGADGSSSPACASIAVPAPEVPSTLRGDKPAGAVNAPATPEAVARDKGYAVVAAVDGATVTLSRLAGPDPVHPAGTLITVVDATTVIVRGAGPAVAADVAVGLEIMYSVTLAETGPHHLDYIDLAGGPAPGPADKPTADAQAIANKLADAEKQAIADKLTDENKQALADKQAVAAAASSISKNGARADGTVWGKGVIEAVSSPAELLVRGGLENSDKQQVRLLLDESTRYFRFDTACSLDGLVVGAGVAFAAIDNGDGSYRATEVRFYD